MIDMTNDNDWDPQPAQLRDGETPDVSGHAAGNAQQIRQGMAEQESAHIGKTVNCYHEHPDDDFEDIDQDSTVLTFEDHGRYVQSPSGEDRFGTPLRERFETSALRFDCQDCERVHWMCPVCSEPDDSDDNSPAGWFRGESTGEQIACHNCNAKEAARQKRGI